MIEFEGILISVSQYKDSDGILNILTNEGYQSLLARGIFKGSNKNHYLLNGFIHGNFEAYRGNVGGLKLRNCSVIKNLSFDFFSYDSIIILDSIKELLFKIKENNDYKILYHELIDFFSYSTKDTRLSDYLKFLYNVLVILGIEPLIKDVNFNYFNINDGTLIKSLEVQCNLTNEEATALKQLNEGIITELDEKSNKKLIYAFLLFISYHFSIQLNSTEFFK